MAEATNNKSRTGFSPVLLVVIFTKGLNMNAEAKLKLLTIHYKAKLANAEYVLSLDEAEKEPDMEYILRQRSNILLLRQFIKDLEK